MLGLVVSMAVALGGLGQVQPHIWPPAPAQDIPAQQEVSIEGIDVVGQRLRDATRTFVEEVAAPPSGRNLATWPDRVCVGVLNLRGQPAQALIERVSAVAASVGLGVGEEGCRPNVIIHFTEDANAAARSFARDNRRGFRVGLSGSDRGETAFSTFQNSRRPVRWWHVSVPVNADTGISQSRLPGMPPPDTPDNPTRPSDFGPMAAVIQPSRIQDPLRDSLSRVMIIVDVDEIQDVTFVQLADYISMIALAQIDPGADTSAADTILNIFDGAGPEALTPWDHAYLEALYVAVQNQANPNSNTSSIADIMARRLRAQQAE
jgi:hypothetical protein